MNENPVRVLLVEDNPGDARLVKEALAEIWTALVELIHVPRLSEGLKRLEEGGIDVVLLDLSLPDVSGLETVRRTRIEAPHVPIVVLTGLDDEAFAVKAVREGAQDYLVKGQFDGNFLVRSMRYAIERQRLVKERQSAEEALKASQDYAQNIIDSSLDMIIAVNKEQRVIEFNPAAQRAFGYSQAEVLGKSIRILYASPEESARIHSLTVEHGNCVQEVVNLRKNGERFPSLVSASALRNARGQVFGVMGISRDITERKQAEIKIQKLASFTQFNPNPVLEFGLDGQLNYFNDAAQQMALSLARNHPTEIFPENTAAIVKECLMTGKNKIRLETTHNDRTISWSFFPIQAIQAVHCYAGDITERKRAELALRQAEDRYRGIFENAGEGISLTTPGGRFITANRALARIYGYDSPEELIALVTDLGRQLYVEPEKRAEVKRLLETEGIVHGFECQTYRKDRSKIWVSINSRIIVNEQGETFYEAIVRDVTDRKRTEEALRKAHEELEIRVQQRTSELQKSNQALQVEITERKQVEDALRASETRKSAIMESALDCIVTIDHEGRITDFNPAAEKVFGYQSAEVIGKEMAAVIIPPSLREKHRRGMAHYRSTGEGPVLGRRIEITALRADGSEFPIELSITRINLEGPPIFTGIIRDITERKQIEADLAKARDQALGSARLKAEFLANMSHEIRTPMNGVIGMTNLLLKTELSKQQRDHAETIRESADSLLKIINHILDFSKIEAGKLTLEILDFDLREEIDSALDLLAERAHAKGIELVSAVQAEVPAEVRGDPVRLRQVLTNLIGNAIKFTERGEVVVRAYTEVEDESRVWVRFDVQDTGIGISPEAQGRLFQAFTQADGSTTRKYGGTGLGLAISKQLVEMMQGRIGVESAFGRGSTFWFTIPLEKKAGSAKPAAKCEPDLADLRVLVVDSNVTYRKILRRQIYAWGMRKGSEASGGEALEILRQGAASGNAYDLALLDAETPEMAGLLLARSIKADPLTAKTKLVVLSSLAHQISTVELNAVGIESSLTKPIKQSHLFECLRAIVGTSTAPEQATAQTVQSRSVVPASSHPQPNKARILLAEDNAINQKVALSQLLELGYQADVAVNGLEVLKALQRLPYDIVLMDCQMPEMDGYETTRQIREVEDQLSRSSQRPIHIIAMTAHVMEGDREKCLRAGMDDYVSKPVHSEELQKALERWETLADKRTAEAISVPEQTGSGELKRSVQASEEVVVDVNRLLKVSSNRPKQMRELANLYLAQSADLMRGLDLAVKEGSAQEVEQLAHKLAGSSASCGMTAILPALRALERVAQEGELGGAEELYAEAVRQFDRIKSFLKNFLESV